jgi:hypothetical protein
LHIVRKPFGLPNERYYNGSALFEFGEGLSYTNFSLACKTQPLQFEAPGAGSGDYGFSCLVSNTGSVVGDEVVQVYHSVSAAIKASAGHPVPIKRLVQFDRVTLAPGTAATITFTVTKKQLELINNSGESVLYPGVHTLTFTRGHGQPVAIPLTITSGRSSQGAAADTSK